MNYLDRKNELLTKKLAELEGRPNREQVVVEDGFQTTISKQDFITLVGWSEERYISRDTKDKRDTAKKKGVIFHKSTGRKENTWIEVTITNFMWRSLMIGKDLAWSEETEAYLEDVFTKKGELELGGVSIVVVLDEYAEKYAQMYGGTVTAAKRKISRVRTPMNEKGYLNKGKKSSLKQKRVVRKGETTFLIGPDAWRLSKEIELSYASFGKDLEAKLSFHPDDCPAIMKQKVQLRYKKIKEHTEFLKVKYGLEKIYNNFGSALSERAGHDYQDIITLFMAGATFDEIKSYLEETLALWKEEETQIQEYEMLKEKANNGDEEAIQKLEERFKKKMEEAYAALDNKR